MNGQDHRKNIKSRAYLTFLFAGILRADAPCDFSPSVPASALMSSNLHFSRLYTLVSDFLRCETESDVLQTKEKEKDLLILLSQVHREVKSWTSELHHFDSNKAMNLEDHDCLPNIQCIMVVLLTARSQYIQHLAGNILVSFSSFLAKSDSKLEEFLNLLWASLEAAIFNIHPSSSVSPPAGSIISLDASVTSRFKHIMDGVMGTTRLDCSPASTISDLQKRLLNANWLIVTSLVRVLRNILKSLKQEYGEFLEAYIHSFGSFPSHLWDLLHEIFVGQSSALQMSSHDISPVENNCSPQSKYVFLGALLQLFCSMVDQNGLEEALEGPFDELPFLTKIIKLVPQLLHWCFSEHADHEGNRISCYLRHKILMLMFRLGFHIRQQFSTLVLWLELLEKYFEDLLYRPLFEHNDHLGSHLEESPFLTSMDGGEKTCQLNSRHLQRRAIFLLFKCSCSLIGLNKETVINCSFTTPNSMARYELQNNSEHYRAKGLTGLSKWLHMHLPSEKFEDSNTCSEICSSFALSFLRLYTDEDDLLLEMLLLLLKSPLTSNPQPNKASTKNFEELKGDFLFHISSIFNPIRLFHLFLAELHYDHLVLLDYLISKDTGVHCAQYLLRCMRMVSKAWHAFVELSVSEDVIHQSLSQHGKVGMIGQGSHEKAEFPSPSIEEIGCSNAPERVSKRRRKTGSVTKTCRQHAFVNAKECLLRLKESVENLHQKNLFPYNPTALLESLERFKELCHSHDGRLKRADAVT